MKFLHWYLTQYLTRAKSDRGFTLLEILMAISLSSIVLLGIGTGLVFTLNSNKKAEAKTLQRTQLNRALDYISEDIRRARTVTVNNNNTPSVLTDDKLVLTYYPDPSVTTSNTITYTLSDASSPWIGPKVLTRLETGGVTQTLVDGISENIINSSSPDTPNTIKLKEIATCTGGTSLNQFGFQVCIKTDLTDNGVTIYNAVVALSGELTDNKGTDANSEVLTTTSKVFSRSLQPLTTPILTVTAVEQPLVSWTTVTGATGYEVYRCQNTTDCTPVLNDTNLFYKGTANSQQETTASDMTKKWCYAVRAYNATINTPLSAPQCGIVRGATPPGVPTALTVTSTSSPNVSWSAPITGGTVDSYQVYRCEAVSPSTSCTPNTSSTLFFNGSALSITESAVPSAIDNRWCYAVRATNANGSSSLTSALCGSPRVAPTTPTGLAVSSSPTPSLTYNAVTGATAYKIYRCLDDNSDNNTTTFCSPSTTVSATNTLWYNGPLTNVIDNDQPGVGNRWCYAVLATNGTDNSSLTTTLVTHCGGVQAVLAPDKPVNPSATSSKTPTVTWTAPSGTAPTGYRVYRCETTTANAACSPNILGTAVSDQLSPLSYTETTNPSTNRKFCYQITAYNTGGTSSGSNLVCGVDNIVAPGTPTNFTVSNAAQPTVTWAAPTTGGSPYTYELYRCQSTSNNSTCTVSTSSSIVYNNLTPLSFTENATTTKNRKWCYAVRATNSAGVSSLTTQACGADGS